jgi:hypothetical protein
MKILRSSLTLFSFALASAVFATACGDDDETPDGGGGSDASVADTGGPRDTGMQQGDTGGGTDVVQMDVGEPGDAGMGGTAYVATLTGAQEYPPVATTANGMGEFTLNGATLTYRVQHDVQNGVAAHIHMAIGGENGAVIAPFTNFGADMRGEITLTAAQIIALENGELYVNVHSMSHPNGEIRGQILRPGAKLFTTRMTGAQEVPPVSTTARGAASVILNEARDRVRVAYTTDATVLAAHVHLGIAGENGAPIFPLSDVGVEQAVTAAQVQELESGLWYANVHTSTNPGGEIRGQITLPGAHLFVARLNGQQEVPPVVTTANGVGQVIMSLARDRIWYAARHDAMNMVAAHIHRAPGGVSGPVAIPFEMDLVGTTTITEMQANSLLRGLWYMNVHTMANMGGEIRGQILRVGETLLTAVLTGAQEVPPVVTNATGGFGLIVSADLMMARYDGVLMNISPTAAHIHRGAAGMTGNVVFPLTVNGTNLSGEITMINAQDLIDLLAGNMYVNVHTMANMGGEIRGQLTQK